MRIELANAATIASQLDPDTLHVWQLDYEPRAGRAPLLGLLAAYLGRPAASLVLVEGEHGRPRLHPALGGALDFNWSHSGRRALVVLGVGAQPGIDIERRRPRPRALQIAQRHFHPAEVRWLASLEPAARSDAFLSLWTAKEATLKALGRGIAFGLHRLQINAAAGPLDLRWIDGDEARAWQLHRLAVDDGYVAALAWRGPPRRVLCWDLPG